MPFQKLSTRTLSGSPPRFCWYIAFIWLLKSCCLARQLIYNTTLSPKVNTFFKISFKFFQTSFLVLPNIHASTLRAAVHTPSQKQMFPLPPIASPVQNAANAASSRPQLLQPVRSTIYSKSSAQRHSPASSGRHTSISPPLPAAPAHKVHTASPTGCPA